MRSVPEAACPPVVWREAISFLSRCIVLNYAVHITMHEYMKKLFLVFALILLSTACSIDVFAQVGFQPEFLGNANASRPGFALKFFPSYFYQEGISAHDVEAAFEPQFWIPGFTGDPNKDQLQFVIHLPVGYRIQNDAAGGRSSVTGIGTLTTAIEHYLHVIDTEDLEFWFDNGIVAGYPTATNHEGARIGGNVNTLRIGGDSYSVGWYQENFIRYGPWIFTISPIAVNYGFRDDKTGDQNGLSLTVMNSAIGYAVASWAHVGLNFGLNMGNLLGDNDAAGNDMATSMRFWAGPGALIVINDDTSLQIAVLIDAYTKNANRGQGAFFALWHHF